MYFFFFFFQYDFVRIIWFSSPLSLRTDLLQPHDGKYRLHQCLMKGMQDNMFNFHTTYPVAFILYAIWYTRNRIVFRIAEAKQVNPEKPLSLIDIWMKSYIQTHAAGLQSHMKVTASFKEQRASLIFNILPHKILIHIF